MGIRTVFVFVTIRHVFVFVGCFVEKISNLVRLRADDQAGFGLVAAELVVDPALVDAVHLHGAVVHVQGRGGRVRRDLHPVRLFQLVAVVEPGHLKNETIKKQNNDTIYKKNNKGHLRLRVSSKASGELRAGSLLDPVCLDLLRDLCVLHDGWKS